MIHDAHAAFCRLSTVSRKDAKEKRLILLALPFCALVSLCEIPELNSLFKP